MCRWPYPRRLVLQIGDLILSGVDIAAGENASRGSMTDDAMKYFNNVRVDFLRFTIYAGNYYDAVCREPIEESDNWLEFWRDERDSLGYFDTAGEVDTFRNLSDGDEYVYYLPGTISESAGLGGADITQKSLQEAINEALSTLTPREEKVLRLRFGLDDRRIRTLEEVGEELNTTRERIRHIEAKALRKLRHPFCSAQLRDFL